MNGAFSLLMLYRFNVQPENQNIYFLSMPQHLYQLSDRGI